MGAGAGPRIRTPGGAAARNAAASVIEVSRHGGFLRSAGDQPHQPTVRRDAVLLPLGQLAARESLVVVLGRARIAGWSGE